MPDGFPENLKRIRENKGLTQRKLSEISGIETSRICSYEKGHHQPTLVVLEWLCQSLEVSASELLGF